MVGAEHALRGGWHLLGWTAATGDIVAVIVMYLISRTYRLGKACVWGLPSLARQQRRSLWQCSPGTQSCGGQGYTARVPEARHVPDC
eukprot:6473859-Alexandrium_andersonii.AAC.1